jgi:beta-galactosidase
MNIERGPVTPAGVYARVVDGRTLYVNSTGETKTVGIEGNKRGISTNKQYKDSLTLAPYQVDLLQ